MNENFQKIPVSNYVNGEAVDRIYGGGHLRLRLVQKDGEEYKGNINKKSITVTSTLDGSRFRSYCYKTDDGRWFDRCGMPMPKPNEIVEDEDNRTEDSQDTEEGIEASSETQYE